MNILYIIIFIINISCFNLVKTSETKCNFSKNSSTEGLINLTYMNCYTYYGDSSMKHGLVHYPNSNTPAYGISKVRGNFKFELKNNKPTNCIKGDCINGDGSEKFELIEKDIFNWTNEDKMVSFYYNYGNYTFKGIYKNYLKYNGVVTDEKGKIVASYVNGQETPTDYFLDKIKLIKESTLNKEKKDIADYYYKLDSESKNREMEYSKREKQELIQFINKMYTLGARDLYSCNRLCNRYNLAYNCYSKCRDSMDINSSSSTPSFSEISPRSWWTAEYGAALQ